MEAWVQLFGGQGDRNRLSLVLREYIWNAPAVSLVLLAPWVLFRVRWSIPLVPWFHLG